jgi:hypothetical protein
MRSGFRLVSAVVLFAVFVAIALPLQLLSQQAVSGEAVAAADLPDAPRVPFSSTPDGRLTAQDQPQQAPTTAPPANGTAPAAGQSNVPAGSSSSQAGATQTGAPQTDAEKSAHEKAEEQLKAQEKQRVMGVMATFNTTRNPDALPLSPGQKFKLYFKSETDPWPFLLAAVVGGIGQAKDTYPEWGQGMKGYARRAGAAYADAFIGNFFGNAVLPTLLREDPRYFQKGKGSVASRILWAAGSTVWCKRDNGGWGPNWANVGGNLIGAAISDTYYPASQRTVTNTIENGFTVSAEGIVGAELIEFWPDMVRHHRQKQAEKLAKQQAAAGQTAKPAPNAAPDPNAKPAQDAKPDPDAK